MYFSLRSSIIRKPFFFVHPFATSGHFSRRTAHKSAWAPLLFRYLYSNMMSYEKLREGAHHFDIHCIYNRFYHLLVRFLLCVPSETEKICFTHFFGVYLGCFGKLLFVSLLPGFFLPHYYPVRFIPAFPGEIRSGFSVLFPLHTDLLPGRMLWAIFLFAFDRHKCFRQSFDLIPLPYFCFPALFTALHPALPRHSDHFSLFPALCEKQPVHFRPLFSTSGSDGNTKRLF